MLKHYLRLPKRYYRRDHYYDFASFFASIPKTAKVLNVGCGRGASLKEYPKGVGIDFNPNLFKLWEEQGIADRCVLANVAKGLGYETWDFDWTISTDFFEHLQPEDVATAVREIVRVAPAGRHVIDLLQESGFRGPEGENLHPSANDAAFWRNAFKDAGARNLSTVSRGKHFFVLYGEALDKAV
jgi:cyclopropane fatty-acyl-phospholipid synthase-like methyltransferase